MKRILAALVGLFSIAYSQVPFQGPGVNTHGMLLPITPLRQLGIRWVRADLPKAQLTETAVRKVLTWYKGFPVLWILPQSCPPGSAALLARWGCRDIEVGNEPEIPTFNPDHHAWSAQRYGAYFRAARNTVGHSARLYGPAISIYDDGYITACLKSGMDPDGITFHGYLYQSKVADVCEKAQHWGIPAICSEIGVDEGAGDPAIWFQAWSSTIKTAWCYYDGPQTDWRGLFSSSGAAWLPDDLFRRIVSAIGLPAAN